MIGYSDDKPRNILEYVIRDTGSAFGDFER